MQSMKQKLFCLNGRLIFHLILLSIVTGCSSPLRVLDYWTSNDFKDYRAMNFLVICHADTSEYGIEIESHIVHRLRKKNINAGESYKIFPSLSLSNSIEEVKRNRDSIKNSGYNGLIFTSVKNIIESYKEGVSIPEQTIQNPDSLLLSNTYVIEAQILDLTRAMDNELVGVNLVSITDPTSAEELFSAYSRIVGRHFKNKPRQ